jgi:fatty acid desaturase
MPAVGAGHALTRLEQQVVGSRNLRHPRWLDFVFGGLDFQIEHHLLPAVPSARLRALQPITRPCCAAVGLAYHEEPPLRALVSVTQHVHRIARGSSAPKSRGCPD